MACDLPCHTSGWLQGDPANEAAKYKLDGMPISAKRFSHQGTQIGRAHSCLAPGKGTPLRFLRWAAAEVGSLASVQMLVQPLALSLLFVRAGVTLSPCRNGVGMPVVILAGIGGSSLARPWLHRSTSIGKVRIGRGEHDLGHRCFFSWILLPIGVSLICCRISALSTLPGLALAFAGALFGAMWGVGNVSTASHAPPWHVLGIGVSHWCHAGVGTLGAT